MLHGKKYVVGDKDEENMINNTKETPSFFSMLSLMNDENNLKESYMQDNHDKWIWIEDPHVEKN